MKSKKTTHTEIIDGRVYTVTVFPPVERKRRTQRTEIKCDSCGKMFPPSHISKSPRKGSRLLYCRSCLVTVRDYLVRDQ